VALPTIVPYSDQLSLVAALASAGERSSMRRFRTWTLIASLGESANCGGGLQSHLQSEAPDVRLQQGDVVYVPLCPTRKLAVFAEGVLTPVMSLTAIQLQVKAHRGERLVRRRRSGWPPAHLKAWACLGLTRGWPVLLARNGALTAAKPLAPRSAPLSSAPRALSTVACCIDIGMFGHLCSCMHRLHMPIFNATCNGG